MGYGAEDHNRPYSCQEQESQTTRSLKLDNNGWENVPAPTKSQVQQRTSDGKVRIWHEQNEFLDLSSSVLTGWLLGVMFIDIVSMWINISVDFSNIL